MSVVVCEGSRSSTHRWHGYFGGSGFGQLGFVPNSVAGPNIHCGMAQDFRPMVYSHRCLHLSIFKRAAFPNPYGLCGIFKSKGNAHSLWQIPFPYFVKIFVPFDPNLPLRQIFDSLRSVSISSNNGIAAAGAMLHDWG